MSKWLHRFDTRVTSTVNKLPSSYQSYMTNISLVGEPYVVLVIGLLGYLLARQRHSNSLQKAFIYAFIAYGINIGLKLVLRRRRPHGSIVKTLGIESYSFPSGHAFGTVIFYGLFAILDIKYINQPFNIIMALLIGFMIVTIGISRVYLGKHYPSDVVAGWAAGLLSLAIISWLIF